MFQGDGTNLKDWNENTKSKFLDRLKTVKYIKTIIYTEAKKSS